MVDQQNTGELWNSKSKSFKIYTKCAISRNASCTITVATSQDEKEEKERIKINIQNISYYSWIFKITFQQNLNQDSKRLTIHTSVISQHIGKFKPLRRLVHSFYVNSRVQQKF